MEQKQTEKSEQEMYEEKLVRIVSEDIEGGMKVYVGLTKVKGVSWGMANAICKVLGIDKNRKIGSLTPEEIKKITEFIKKPKVPSYLLNRRKDFETGHDMHLSGSDLELQKEFDIKRLKKIKSYRGIRHAAGLPTRGQRTRSHFRKNRPKGSGIKSKEKKSERPKGEYVK
ncbi:MAG: 30S ribosomal protein S13 [Candidatus Pacearchaeota archaeon]|nr:30S ribosomal protein S13 [Nanoarchaeota archaeon]MDZ4226602.1 30S ribosomal protein S13 [Candidatus Pacearchaeota archaeon]